MNVRTPNVLRAAAIASALMFGATIAAEQAGAVPVSFSLPRPQAVSANFQQVAWIYVPARHGLRFRHRRAGFPYLYGGYYYASPFWLQAGPVAVGVAPRPWTSAWFGYCAHKYGHFDRRTGKFRRGGKWFACI